ncbi:MAG: ABC transporter permease [Blastopirellula sp.]|nr:MAG: ABC transporter permease [Blastopirellula sp.]
MKNEKLSLLSFVLPLVTLGVVIALWQITVTVGQFKIHLLPAPLDVANVLADTAMRENLWAATCRTGKAAMGGFTAAVIIGVLTSLLFSQAKWIRQSGYPYAIFFQTVPIVAIAPFVIRLFGFGLSSVMVVSAIISLFPIITNTTTGLISVDPKQLELFHLNRASRWQILWKLQFPSAIRFLMTGMKTSSGLAVVGAIVGEFFTGGSVDGYGLGYYIRLTSDLMKTPELFAYMICSTLLGVIAFLFISLVERFLLKRWIA